MNSRFKRKSLKASNGLDSMSDGVQNMSFKNCIAMDELMILKNGIEKTKGCFR